MVGIRYTLISPFCKNKVKFSVSPLLPWYQQLFVYVSLTAIPVRIKAKSFCEQGIVSIDTRVLFHVV